MPERKRINITEFREFGYLAAVNVEFFHPLGLALEVSKSGNAEVISGVWDSRDDPEGIIMGEVDKDLLDKLQRVRDERDKRTAARLAALNYVVQVPDDYGRIVAHMTSLSDTQLPGLLVALIAEAERRGTIFKPGGAERIVRKTIERTKAGATTG